MLVSIQRFEVYYAEPHLPPGPPRALALCCSAPPNPAASVSVEPSYIPGHSYSSSVICNCKRWLLRLSPVRFSTV
ncbi:hypothetical protein L6164_002041 [Bauhinia variegata]|uniref:Uncharacterized protein n=1 Tax=Bauhinia variegata TaxID=167791 RepID=A0ACB9PYG7_BAUVA|nr:hypothetical protein L6164_002041 [Bauhinia variegata]